jgi:hypothetical protein
MLPRALLAQLAPLLSSIAHRSLRSHPIALSANLPIPSYSCVLATFSVSVWKRSVALAPVSAVPSPAEHALQSFGCQKSKGSKSLPQRDSDFDLRG